MNNTRAHCRSQVRKGEEQNFKRVVENIIRFKAAANARQQASQGQPEDIFECKPSELNEHLRVSACACRRAFVLLLLIFILLLYVLLSSILFHFIYRHHHLNRNLQDLIAWQGLVQHIPGMKLSAKVFRTFNASQCLAEQLYATRS